MLLTVVDGMQQFYQVLLVYPLLKRSTIQTMIAPLIAPYEIIGLLLPNYLYSITTYEVISLV